MLSNITLSAEKDLIARARARAQAHNTTLNAEFRAWLQTYADEEAAERVRVFDEIMSRMTYADSGGRKFTRDEMNERR
ncbi:hypothetical protein [Polycyclovorans algicola]|uniref:hypothetical protein n=1 Tax=Polycyclovorans algicola TaxID=616992 RepID=UPI0004A71998|nr:hypothetical protein [Polycyclovorans algicola]